MHQKLDQVPFPHQILLASLSQGELDFVLDTLSFVLNILNFVLDTFLICPYIFISSHACNKDSAKNGECSEISPDLQVKLECRSFMDAGKQHDFCVRDKVQCTNHCKSSSQRIGMHISFSNSLSQRGI
uniref:Uncharacterized protein n=1 Tax=Myotis myotis TaxID=51298 RepID=A0A7J7ZXM0_MYOMY|nr:hypothetical protein mMyoMyo1_009708 [Myotis myotis]